MYVLSTIYKLHFASDTASRVLGPLLCLALYIVFITREGRIITPLDKHVLSHLQFLGAVFQPFIEFEGRVDSVHTEKVSKAFRRELGQDHCSSSTKPNTGLQCSSYFCFKLQFCICSRAKTTN